MIEDLTFLYDPEHFSWLRRHVLHWRCKCAIRRARRAGAPVEVASQQVADDLHKYYRVPVGDVKIVSRNL